MIIKNHNILKIAILNINMVKQMIQMDKVNEKFLTLVFFEFITFFNNKIINCLKISHHKKG